MINVSVLTKFIPAILAFLSKKTKMIVITIVSLIVVWYAYNSVWQRGYDERDAIAKEEMHQTLAAQKKIRQEYARQERKMREDERDHLINVLEKEKLKNEELLSNIDDFYSSGLRVRVKQESVRTGCDRESVSESGNSGAAAEGTVTRELSYQAARGIGAVGEDADSDALQLSTLIDLLKNADNSCIEIIGDESIGY